MNLTLVAFKPDHTRRDFHVKGAKFVIGRRPDADLRIIAATVSRRHCEITVAGDKVAVRDLGSSNGTFLNEVRVQEATLAPGDRLAVGPAVFVIQIDGKPEHIEPVTSQTMPTGGPSDPSSATSAPIQLPLDESSMIDGAPAIDSDDSGAPAAPQRPPQEPSSDDKPAEDDPLSRMISRSKSEDDSSVFEFDFDDEEEEDR